MTANSIAPLLRRSKAAIMGIVNITPDSFSDGGLFLKTDLALKHALALVRQGADLLDVGGESTRPGAEPVALQQELDRVIPVIERLCNETDTPISVDTSKPEVMASAVAAGAAMINDVNALRAAGAAEVAAETQAVVCIMHMLKQPRTMQQSPRYSDVVAEVNCFLRERINHCIKSGINKSQVVVDPGIGFGKTLEHNLKLLNAVPMMRSDLGCELLIGVSRKSMIDALLGRPTDKRLPASLGLAVQAVLNGAKIVRVHDVRATVDAIRSVEAVRAIDFK